MTQNDNDYALSWHHHHSKVLGLAVVGNENAGEASTTRVVSLLIRHHQLEQVTWTCLTTRRLGNLGEDVKINVVSTLYLGSILNVTRALDK